jgi:hypothetical protein
MWIFSWLQVTASHKVILAYSLIAYLFHLLTLSGDSSDKNWDPFNINYKVLHHVV